MGKFKLGQGLLVSAIILSVSGVAFAQQQQQQQQQHQHRQQHQQRQQQQQDADNENAKQEWYQRSQVQQSGKPVQGDYPDPEDLFDD